MRAKNFFLDALDRVQKFHQGTTERVVKTIRKIEQRFPNFNEVNEAKRKRDRAKQEIFLHENSVEIIYPLKN